MLTIIPHPGNFSDSVEIGTYEKATLGTLTVSHSSGKESKACGHRIGKRPQEHTECQLLRVSSPDTKHRIIGRIWNAPTGKNTVQNWDGLDPSLPHTGAVVDGRSVV